MIDIVARGMAATKTGQVAPNTNNSEIFNDYENNKVLAPYSHAEGSNTIAGCKAYYIKSVDTTNNIIYLNKTQTTPVINTVDNTDTSFGNPGYAVNDEVCIINDTKFDLLAKITAIDNNKITLDNIPFTTINGSIENDMDYTLYVPSKPNVDNQYAVSVNIVAHSEGVDNKASGYASHSEGRQNISAGQYSHTEGRQNIASYASHAEGRWSRASGQISHAEGFRTKSKGDCSHSEGRYTVAKGDSAHAEGHHTEAFGSWSHAEGNYTHAIGANSHSEGRSTIATRANSHVEGEFNIKDTEEKYLHILGNGNSDEQRSNAHTIDKQGNAWFLGDVLVGTDNEKLITENDIKNKLPIKDLEGQSVSPSADKTVIAKPYSTIIGDVRERVYDGNGNPTQGNVATAYNSTVVGTSSTATGFSSTAIGTNAEASGAYSISMGYKTKSKGEHSIAMGNNTQSIGRNSLSIGEDTQAKGQASMAEGKGTIATRINSHVEGEYNIEDTEKKYLHITGNGTAEAPSNAYTLDEDGNAWFAGDITTGNSNDKIATENYVTNKFVELIDTAPDTLNTLNELAQALGDDPNFATTIATELGNKVDKIEGKGLSTNDFTNEEKSKLASITPSGDIAEVEIVDNLTSTDIDKALSANQGRILNDKIDAIKDTVATTSVDGLMSSTDKTKLDGIDSNANNYTLPSAGTSLGGVKSGGDVTISSGIITVNDNSHNHSASNITTGTLSIARGGTGATTASEARANLDVPSTAEVKTYVVTVIENDDGTYTADKTFSEVITAYQNGQNVICSLEDFWYGTISLIDSSYLIFSIIQGSHSKLITLWDDNSVTVNRKDLQTLVVTVSGNETDGYTATKTSEEIIAAHNNGQRVICKAGIRMCDIAVATSAIVVFSSVDKYSEIRIQIYGDMVSVQYIDLAPQYEYGTTDLTAGTSELATGKLYFVYE